MPSDLVAVVAEEFGPAADPVAAAGSASAAGVYRARTARGREVYLKVTPAEPGQPAPPAAHRELSFYREPAPALPVRSPRLLGAVDDDRGVALLPLLRRVGRHVVGGPSCFVVRSGPWEAAQGGQVTCPG